MLLVLIERFEDFLTNYSYYYTNEESGMAVGMHKFHVNTHTHIAHYLSTLQMGINGWEEILAFV